MPPSLRLPDPLAAPGTLHISVIAERVWPPSSPLPTPSVPLMLQLHFLKEGPRGKPHRPSLPKSLKQQEPGLNGLLCKSGRMELCPLEVFKVFEVQRGSMFARRAWSSDAVPGSLGATMGL